jgi:VanZ family protein
LFLFTAIAWVASARPLVWRWSTLLLFALGLALMTEGLQFFAIDRHPSWRDVGIDLCGAFLGMLLGHLAGLARMALTLACGVEVTGVSA